MSKPQKYVAVDHAHYLPLIGEIAVDRGYAVALLASAGNDLQLILIPWHAEAWAADRVVEAIHKGICVDMGANYSPLLSDAIAHSHGRLAWTISLFDDYKIDISVMPRSAGAAQ